MAQHDVFKNSAGKGYLLDVQSDLLSGLNSRMVVPLLPIDHAPAPADRLNPLFTIKGQQFVMATQFMAAIPARELGVLVDTLSQHRNEINNALDMLLVGF